MRKIFFILFLFTCGECFGQQVAMVVPKGHPVVIKKMAVSPNGRFMASADRKTAIMWDVKSQKKIHEIAYSAENTYSVAVTDNGERLLIANNNGLLLYNMTTGQQVNAANQTTTGACFSGDGSKIYNFDYGSLQIINATTGQLIKTFDGVINNPASGYKIHETGDAKLLILHTGGWSLFNMQTGIVFFEKKLDYAKKEEFTSFDYCKKDDVIIGVTDESGDDYIKTFAPATGAILKIKKSDYVSPKVCATDRSDALVFGRDLKTKAYGVEMLKVADMSVLSQATQPFSIAREYAEYAYNIAQAGTSNNFIYTVEEKLWQYNRADKTFAESFKNNVSDFRNSFIYSNLSDRLLPDNKFYLATDDNLLCTFSYETIKPANFVRIPGKAVFSPDGKLVAGIGNKITINSLATGKIIKTLPLPVTVDAEGESFFFSYDNTRLIYTDRRKGSISAINIATGIATKLYTFSSGFFQCSASFDGKYFACLAQVKNVDHLAIINLQTKQLALNKPAGNFYKTDESPDVIKFLNDSHYLITLGQSSNVRIYNADKPDFMNLFTLQHINKLQVFGGDIGNNMLALGELGSTGLGAYNIKLLTLEGKLMKEFSTDGNKELLKVSFSKDDKIMLAANTQKGIEVWDISRTLLLGTYYLIEKTNEYIFVSTEGLFDGSVDGMKALYFVRNNRPVPLENLYERFYTPNILNRKINGEIFAPPDLSNLHQTPLVKITYAQVTRNLDVVDDKTPAYSNTSGAAEITVNASAENDKVEEIRLFHNGKIANLANRGLFVTDNTTGTESKKYTITLLPGVNNVRAVALNSQRTESEPDDIIVNYNINGQANVPAPVNNITGGVIDPVDRNATLHLVVVGINAYKNPKMSLNYALADATAFKDEAERDARTIITNVKTYFVTDDKADKNGIIAAFTDVQKNAKPQDVFVFYYAGHGVISEKNKEFYLVPNDVTDLKNVDEALAQNGIPSKMLQQYAIDIAAQKQVFILDACQSAGAFATLMTNDANQQKSFAVVARSTGTHWIAASGSQQFANEFSQLGHGAFTYVLLKAMKGEAASNKMVTVNGLKNFLQVQVPDLMKKYNGTPQYPASYGFGDDFPVEVMK